MSDSHHPTFINRRVLKFNVGFLLAEGAGYQRTNDLDLPRVQIADDVELEYLRGYVRMTRNARGIWVEGVLETGISSECARCLAPIQFPVTLEIQELFAFPPSSETVYSVEETGMLDLAPLLREEAILAIPMGVLCKPNCAGLCPECGQNLNEGQCACGAEDIDPRLAALLLLRDDHAQS